MCGSCDDLTRPPRDFKQVLSVVAPFMTSFRHVEGDGNADAPCVTYEPMLISCVAQQHWVKQVDTIERTGL